MSLPEHSLWTRLLSRPSRGRLSAAAVVGLLALGAFGASLIVEWQVATVAVEDLSQNGQQAQQLTGSVGMPIKLALTFSEWVYVAGGIALLAVTGWAIMNSEWAARLRGLILGAGGGLLAVVIALIVRAGDTTTSLFSSSLMSRATLSIRPGALCAVAAAVLPIVAVFLASARVTAPAEAPPPQAVLPAPAPAEIEVVEEPPAVWMPTGHRDAVSGLTVTSADPRQGEQWRR
jgi:hypothetical protein